MSSSTIKLKRFTSDINRFGDQHAWPLSVIAVGSDGAPSEIFVYRFEGSIYDPREGDTFHRVASVNDLYEVPKLSHFLNQSADSNLQVPFYRTDRIPTLFCRSPEEVQDVWDKIVEDVHSLVKNLNTSVSLKAIDEVTIDGVQWPLQTQNVMSSQTYYLQLSYEPAGTPTLSGEEQDITSPDDSIRGWLPVSEVPGSFTAPVPSDAKYFYNISQDSNLAQYFPLDEPYEAHYQIYYNGLKLGSSVITVTEDTIYWKDFNPTDEDFFGDGNAPWPIDYTSVSNPGPIHPSIELYITRDE